MPSIERERGEGGREGEGERERERESVVDLVDSITRMKLVELESRGSSEGEGARKKEGSSPFSFHSPFLLSSFPPFRRRPSLLLLLVISRWEKSKLERRVATGRVISLCVGSRADNISVIFDNKNSRASNKRASALALVPTREYRRYRSELTVFSRKTLFFLFSFFFFPS